jgi:hypothetical protein
MTRANFKQKFLTNPKITKLFFKKKFLPNLLKVLFPEEIRIYYAHIRESETCDNFWLFKDSFFKLKVMHFKKNVMMLFKKRKQLIQHD